MTSWIITIGKEFEENWDRAVAHQLWDLTKTTKIRTGDSAFFWQASNQGFRGWVQAVTDASNEVPLPRPWIPADHTEYRQRFHFRVIQEQRIPGNWGQFSSKLNTAQGLNSAPFALHDPADEAYLRSLFWERLDINRPSMEIELQLEREEFLSTDDKRRLSERLIAIREGQPGFRVALVDAYDGECAVTGTSVLRVLEAAHIAPYLGVHSNAITNGLLLRSDIHTLFDDHQLAITDANTAVISPELRESEYTHLAGVPLRHPRLSEQAPSRIALSQHYERCGWTAIADVNGVNHV